MVFSVIGMHKSGTTLAAQILDASGVPMVEGVDTRSYDAGNKCERLSTNEMNKKLLACGSKNSLRVLAEYQTGKDLQSLKDSAQEIVMQAKPQGGEYWGFKDPRNCLTHPFWAELIPDLRVICIFRSASSVRRHYVARKSKIRNNGVRALRAWAVYNTAVIRIFEQTRPDHRILLSYDALLGDDTEFARMQRFVGLPLKDLRRPELNRRKREKGIMEKVEARLVKMFWGLDVPAIENRLAVLFQEDRAQAAST